MQRFERLLLAPAIILGTPAKAGLNQKNSTSLTLGTQTAFDFHPPPADLTPRCSRRLYPKMINGTRKNLSNLLLKFITYLRDTSPARRQKPFAIYNRLSDHLVGKKNAPRLSQRSCDDNRRIFLEPLLPFHRFYSAVAVSVGSEKF